MESLAPEGHLAHKWILDKGEIALLGFMGDDKLIADTARVSYRKGTKQTSTDKQLIRYLQRNRHTGPFEHACVRFYVKAPLFVIQQLLRHRTFKFNQASARYSEMLNEAYVPNAEHITTQDSRNKQARTDRAVDDRLVVHQRIADSHTAAFDDYNYFLQNSVARELARINMPHGTYSELIATVDLHNLLHFLALRLHPHAQYEIRVYAEAMLDFIKGLFPAAIEAWEDCVLNSFTLTGSMQEVLSSAIYLHGQFKASNSALKWPEAVTQSAEAAEWVSKSEKDQFISWCCTKLRV